MTDEEMKRLERMSREMVESSARPLASAILALIERVRKAEARAMRMETALRRVVRWDGFPRVPDRDDPTKDYSYGYAYGSNGERDYMRDIAAKALAEP